MICLDIIIALLIVAYLHNKCKPSTDLTYFFFFQIRMNGVNGLNGHTNGELNGSGKGTWTIGLINVQFRYLTAETFGFKINANGASLKKKQMWTLEPVPSESQTVYLKSHLDKYLAVDSFGNVTCESEEKEQGSKFQIQVSDEGRWALRNVARGYYLGASSDKLTCTAKVPGNPEYWLVHLAARPQVRVLCYPFTTQIVTIVI